MVSNGKVGTQRWGFSGKQQYEAKGYTRVKKASISDKGKGGAVYYVEGEGIKEQNRDVQNIQQSRGAPPQLSGNVVASICTTSEDAKAENSNWLQQSAVSNAKNILSLSKLQEYLHTDGIFTVRVSPLGGDLVLFTFDTKDIVDGFINAEESWLKQSRSHFNVPNGSSSSSDDDDPEHSKGREDVDPEQFSGYGSLRDRDGAGVGDDDKRSGLKSSVINIRGSNHSNKHKDGVGHNESGSEVKSLMINSPVSNHSHADSSEDVNLDSREGSSQPMHVDPTLMVYDERKIGQSPNVVATIEIPQIDLYESRSPKSSNVVLCKVPPCPFLWKCQ
ncbi:hypothetical protein GH714_015235 [Hevea brasiliensis]|uniref:Uncharacterized protein n=1 Tax=Hevea brasiliensis TaxID=3981 RepID=A0A6A6LAG0_HEVBR|nr:hypothetical protein GH714_015235 [Hevea brasiliensis]